MKNYPACKDLTDIYVSDDCLLQKEVGNCRGNIPRWYYDARSGRCYEFSYGGCQGNGNNFGDESSCYDSCRGIRVDEPEPVTSRPPVVGM